MNKEPVNPLNKESGRAARAMSVFVLMDDKLLAAALVQLEQQVAQLDYLREPAPDALRAGLVDALDRARLEAERRFA